MWKRSSRPLPIFSVVVTVLTATLLGGVLAACGEEAVAAPTAPPGDAMLVDEAQAAALRDSGALVVDVRTQQEYREGHVVGAQHIPVEDPELWEQRVAALDPERAVVVYCRTGRRSAEAATLLVERGFAEVYDAGGIVDFTEGALPLDR